jgi:hypothetical protein
MTEKKLRLVRARLFAACPVRRGARHLDDECAGLRAERPGARAAHGCGARPGGAVSRASDHGSVTR